MSTSARQQRGWTAGALLLAAGLGCADSHAPDAGSRLPIESREVLAALILSNPAVPGLGTASGSRGALVDPVVYASLPPGSVVDGELAVFANMTTGAGATVVLVGGGFDPVPVPASAGDSLCIRIQLRGDSAERLFYAKVPPRRPPVVVRSDPAPGRRDVPLNSRVLVVFSEPMSTASISDGTVYLLRGDARVSGTLAFVDSAHLTLAFTPASALTQGAGHELHVTPTLMDGDGDPLETEAIVQFVTAASGMVPAGDTTPLSITYDGVTPQTAQQPYQHMWLTFNSDGRFVFGYSDPRRADLAYEGRYSRVGPVLSLQFDAWSSAGPMEATAMLGADTLKVKFNIVMQLTDFEDGDYVPRTQQQWEPMAAIAEARSSPGFAAVDGTIYLVGGMSEREGEWTYPLEILALDPGSASWRVAGRLNRGVQEPGVAVVEGRIYLLGGLILSSVPNVLPVSVSDVQVFDPATGLVETAPPLPSAASGVAAVEVDGRIHVLGGVRFTPYARLPSTDHYVFDRVTRSWSARSPLPHSFANGQVAAFIDGRIYVVGGGDVSVDSYDPAADTWSSRALR